MGKSGNKPLPTREENWAILERQRDSARAQLQSVHTILIADQVLRAGFHPYRGSGRAILEILVARHRGHHDAPLIPEISHSDVVSVAVDVGATPDFEPVEVAHV